MPDPAKILIVDDEALNVDYLEQELQDLGHETISAGNGQEALDRVAADPPDLILLDVMMPVMDGFTACRILKGDDVTRFIPIIFMTSLGDVDDRVKGAEAGADDFLTKPVNERELIARIEGALKLKQAFDRKIDHYNRITDHLEKFVPPEARLMAGTSDTTPEPPQRELDCSILFVDITGYSRLCEALSPNVITGLVERYFTEFLDRIADGGGDMIQSAGDGFMAIFQDDDPKSHAVNAIDTALSLLAATRDLNDTQTGPDLAIHMGLASGVVLIGSSRFEGRRQTRWVFSATGQDVNIAARLAALAEPDQILISPRTAERLDAGYRLKSLGHRPLKNISQVLDIHTIDPGISFKRPEPG